MTVLQPQRNPHVLVADDSRTVATALAIRLRRSGFDVTLASCGEEALEIARRRHVDLVISDYQMLAMSGIELCRQLRARADFRNTPFILLTAKDFEFQSAEARERYGLTLVLGKPFSPARVVEIVRECLERPGHFSTASQ